MKRIAEALVKCGYAKEIDCLGEYVVVEENNGRDEWIQETDPFADTLEGRRQADALEDWLCSKYELIPDSVWEISSKYASLTSTRHQWRLDRIKWCMNQLEKEDEHSTK